MYIQILLIVISFLILMKALSSRGSHTIDAWKKIGIILLVLVMIVSILNPDMTTVVANYLGIGRGADLLLYLLAAAFFFYVLTQYIKSHDQRDKLYCLARQVAIIEAKNRYDIK
jgi:small membrane protein